MKVNRSKALKLLIFSIFFVILLNRTYVLTEKTEELVYKNRNKKLSELTWELENVPIFGFEAKTKIADDSREMNDSDWLKGDDNSWTHHSNHKTSLDIKYELINSKNYNFSTSLGFRHDKFKWEAYDGEGTYLNSNIIFYGKGITYDQKLYAPYTGLDFNYQKNKWN